MGAYQKGPGMVGLWRLGVLRVLKFLNKVVGFRELVFWGFLRFRV